MTTEVAVEEITGVAAAVEEITAVAVAEEDN
jgi:hypothetical protein